MEYAIDCLTTAARMLQKIQKENDDIWKNIVMKIVLEWDAQKNNK